MPAIVIHLLDKSSFEDLHGTTHNIPTGFTGIPKKVINRGSNRIGWNHDVIAFNSTFGNTTVTGISVSHMLVLCAGGQEIKWKFSGRAGSHLDLFKDAIKHIAYQDTLTKGAFQSNRKFSLRSEASPTSSREGRSTPTRLP